MGRSGGGGGSRGFSGGGGRGFSSRGGGSFGGGRSGGSFGGGSFGGGHSGSSFGGGNRHSSDYNTNFGGPAFGAPVPPVRPRPVYYNSGRVYSGAGNGRGMGCGAAAIIFLVVAFIIVFVIATSFGGLFWSGGGSSSGGDITTSTVQREALPAGSVNETGYYTDELDWISNRTVMERGLKNFYHKTGVQPYVYITGTVNGDDQPTQKELQAFTEGLYDQLFTDEAHLLLVFFENTNEDHWEGCNTGTLADTVIDTEARDILLDYIERNYYDNSLTDEEFFSKSFSDAADRIMTVTTSPWIPVLIVLGVVMLVVILFVWWRHAKKQKNLEAKQTEDMLNTPLDKFDDQPAFDDEAERRARNYDGNPDNDIKP